MKNYKDVIFEGSTFPDSPYHISHVSVNDTIATEYLPALQSIQAPKGLKLLATAMAIEEGFHKGSRAYITHNPGNIGNTDSGANHTIANLTEGIKLQLDYLTKVANGQNAHYPLGKAIFLKPDFSQEIHDNPNYGLGDGHMPGYRFTYTGQLDQFVKIYSTGARLTNSYINLIISYFSQNGVTILPTSKLADIIKIQ